MENLVILSDIELKNHIWSVECRQWSHNRRNVADREKIGNSLTLT
jgi:hypothetical protein